MSNYVIYHHDDPDGHVAGAILYNYLVNHNHVDPEHVATFAKNYNDQFTDHEQYKGTADDQLIVYITDLSFTNITFNKLLNICNSADAVYWFDHHKSSESVAKNDERIEELMDACEFNYIFSTDLCGAGLSWIYTDLPEYRDVILNSENLEIYDYDDAIIIDYHGDGTNEIMVKLPTFIYHIDAYDRWTKKDQDADAFICGIKASTYGYKLNHQNIYSDDGLYNPNNMDDDTVISQLIVMGKVALNYYMNVMQEQSEYIGIWNIGEYKIAYKNAVGQSWNFNDLVDSMKVDAGVLGHFDPKYNVWRYSIYANANSDVKANKIAELFDGGGHPGAAGFSTDICFFDPDNHWTNYNNAIVKPIWEVLGLTVPDNENALNSTNPMDKIWLDGNNDKRWRNILKQYLDKSIYIDGMHTNCNIDDTKYHLFVFTPVESAIPHYQKIFNRLMKYVINHRDGELSNRVSVFIVDWDNDTDVDWDVIDSKYTDGNVSIIEMIHAIRIFCNAHSINVTWCERIDDLIFNLGKYIADVIKDMNNNK